MADLEELVVRIKADASSLEREMRKAQTTVQQSSRGMQSALKGVTDQAYALLPALSVAAVAAFAKGAFTAADRINDLALRTGFAGSTLSSLNIKLLQSGTDLDSFAASINRMNNMIGEAARGLNKEAVRSFDNLGLSVRKLAQLSPEDQFFEIAQALGGIENQNQQVNLGMAIFGRQFTSLLPMIKETKGELRSFSDEAKRMGLALTDEQLKRIDDLGDRWVGALEKMKIAILDVVPLVEGLAKVPEILRAALIDIPHAAGKNIGLLAQGIDPRDVRTLPEVEVVAEKPKKPSTRGGNADLFNAEEIKKAKQALADFNKELNRQHEFAGMAPRDAAAQKVYYDTLELAQKAGVKNAEELAQANANVARSTYDMNQSMSESARFAAELKDQFAQTAGSIIRDSKNAGDALKRLGDALADMITQRYILGPLADQLFGSPGGGGGLLGGLMGGGGVGGGFSQLFDNAGAYLGMNESYGPPMPGYAEGGNPPVGSPYVVGENGPEIRIDRRPGTIIPNHAIGGTNVTVQQTIQINPGVPELINARIREAAPAIAAQAQQGVFAAIQKGGREAKIVGRRN